MARSSCHSSPQAASALQRGWAHRNELQPHNHVQPPLEPQPHQQPIPIHEEQPVSQHHDLHQGQVPHSVPPAPRTFPTTLTGSRQTKVDKRTLQLLRIDLDARSLTMSFQRHMTYAIENFRRFDYMPLWYFTEHGCQAANKDDA
jgi:hypothetical protein